MEGHATHFLEQLSRASGLQAELALELYYEPEVFRSVLRNARIPNAYNRVAVSLHREDEGPYIIASRDGDFITCLGAGMKTRHTYLIRYFELLSIMDNTPGFKERMKMAESLVGGGKNLNKLLNRVVSKGKCITREDFLAISALQKSLKSYLVYCWWKTGKGTIAVFRQLALVLEKQKRFKKKDHKNLRLYWNLYHGVGHFALLFSMTGVRDIENTLEENEKACHATYEYFAYINDFATLIKHVWSLSRLGDVGYKICKSFFIEPSGGPIWLLGLIGLSVIALFRREYLQEIKELFTTTSQMFYLYDQDVFDGLAVGVPERMLEQTIEFLKNPDDICCDSKDASAKHVFYEYYKKYKILSAYRWKSPETVPENLAYAFLVNAGLPLFDARITTVLMEIIPWLSRCDAQDFYLEEKFHKYIDMSWTPGAAKELVRRQRTRKGEEQKGNPIANRTRRNDPCPCGSQKKYKKCCLGKNQNEV